MAIDRRPGGPVGQLRNAGHEQQQHNNRSQHDGRWRWTRKPLVRLSSPWVDFSICCLWRTSWFDFVEKFWNNCGWFLDVLEHFGLSFLEEITTWSQRHFYSGEKEMKCTALRDTRPGGFRLAVRWRGAEIIFWLWEKKGKNSRRMCWRFLIYFYLIYSWCGIFFNKIYFQFYFQVPTGGTFP